MMRHIAVLLSLMIFALGLKTYSATLKAPEIVPSNNSEISSFDIKLKFDLTEIAAEIGNDNIAVGYSGSKRNNFNTRLYDGTPESGTLLSTVFTSYFDGSINSRDIIEIPIPSSLVPEPGRVYTLVCNNQFVVIDQNTKDEYGETLLNLKTEPLTFTFFGGQAGSEELILQKTSLTENENIDILSHIIVEYNEDISLTGSNEEVKVFEGENLIVSS